MEWSRKFTAGLLSVFMAFSSLLSVVSAEEIAEEAEVSEATAEVSEETDAETAVPEAVADEETPIVTGDDNYDNVFHYANHRAVDEYTENFYGSSYVIYADGKVDAASASALLNDLAIIENIEKYGWDALVVGPVAEEYGEADQALFAESLIDMVSAFGTKVIGIGKGADFVNEYITAKSWAVSGFMIYDASNTGDYGDIPAYVSNSDKEPLSAAFANGWESTLSAVVKLGNIGGTFYNTANHVERPFEFIPFTITENLGITRTVVKEDLDADGIDSLWYEYIPETASSEEGSVPMVLLLHGNTNDPRTQYETSGWAQLAAEKGVILIEAEWQGTSFGADPIADADLAGILLDKVFEKYPQIDQSRVYVEGLSAGSAKTLTLLVTHPEAFTTGGSHSGAAMGNSSSLDAAVEALKDQYDMPYYFIGGEKDSFVPVSEKGGATSGVLKALNLFEAMNEMPLTAYEDCDEETVEWFGFTKMTDFGVVENDGSCVIKGGTIVNDEGVPMMSFNAIENWGHWNYAADAELMYEFFMQFSRDPETGELFYNGQSSGSKDVTVTGAEAMELAEVPEAVREIIDVQDTTVSIDGEDAYTDLYVGEDGFMELPDNNYVTGYSYYNMMELTSWVKQLEKALEGTDVKNIHYRGTDTVITKQYLDDLNELLDRINAFDHSQKIRYDFEKTSSNYIAENGEATLEFHVQINGYWGYDLAGDSIIDKVTGLPGGYSQNQQLNNTYANFFAVDMGEKFPGMYVLNDTDLQNPILFMDEEEAFLIDVDFRGGQHFYDMIKELTGERALYIYITHAHGDHYQNMSFFSEKEVAGFYWGQGESKPNAAWFNALDTAGKVSYYRDGTTFTRAGKDFRVIVMNNHTSGGSQLADLTDRILFTGDTIGSQTFKGGTNVTQSQVDNWIAQFDHSASVLNLSSEDRLVDYIITGHTAHLNSYEFQNWVYATLKEGQEKGSAATTLNPIGQTTIVWRDGKILSAEENLACFLNGTPVPAISDEEVQKCASINLRHDTLTDPFTDLDGAFIYDRRSYNTDEGRLPYVTPTYLIFPDAKVNISGADALLRELGIIEHINEYDTVAYVINPYDRNWDERADGENWINVLNAIGGPGNVKVIGIGNGANFVDRVISKNAWAVAGIMTYNSKANMKDTTEAVPAYVSNAVNAVNQYYIRSANAVEIGSEGKVTCYQNPDNELINVATGTDTTMAEAFANAWKYVFSKNYRQYNEEEECYTAGLTKYRSGYLISPYPMYEELGLTYESKKGLITANATEARPNQWYEVLPEEIDSAAEASIPLLVVLHGNGNDNRTQLEASGWASKAGKERFAIIAAEWQASRNTAIFGSFTALGEQGTVDLVKKVLAEHPALDPSRVYVQGLSAGASSSYNYAMNHNDVFTAVEGSSAPNVTGSNALTNKAKEIRAAGTMIPVYVLAGTNDTYRPIPATRGIGLIRAYADANGIDTPETQDFNANKYYGIQLDNQGYYDINGQNVLAGTLSNELGVMMKVVAMEPYAHWNNPLMVDDIWDFFMQYRRNQETGKIEIAETPFEFEDVNDPDKYYYDPVYWALENGITTGTSPTTFSPDDKVTRGQIVTFLYRAAGEPEVTGDMPFTDVTEDKYFYDAVLWALENNITVGTSPNKFSPNDKCTREQVVTFLYRYAGEPEVSGTTPFKDVPADAYYANAVAWAYENNITTGTSVTKFSPDGSCTRGQAVTFLYRAVN